MGCAVLHYDGNRRLLRTYSYEVTGCGDNRRWVGGTPVSRLQTFDCPAKTAVVMATKREADQQGESESISINWGEFPVAARCVRGCVWGKLTPGTYKTGSCWADSAALLVTHGAVSPEPCTALAAGLTLTADVSAPALSHLDMQVPTPPPSSRQKPEGPTQKLCLCFCSLGRSHGCALCGMVALLPCWVPEQAGLLQPWAASPLTNYNFPAPIACVRGFLPAFWWNVWQGRVTQQLF